MKHLLSTVFFIIFLWAMSLPLQAQQQQNQETYQEPDLPGVLYLGIGWSFLNNRPESMNLNIWGSRAFQAYYMYVFDLKESLFSVRPGFGISSYKFKFDTQDIPGETTTLIKTSNSTTEAVPVNSRPGLQGITNMRKSQFEIVYIDIPVELVYNGAKEMEQKGFYFALGVRGGLRIDSKTKLVFFQGGERRKVKTKNNLNLRTLRYSVGARVGKGKFNLFYWWTINDIFQEDEGPTGTNDTNYMTFGLALSIL